MSTETNEIDVLKENTLIERVECHVIREQCAPYKKSTSSPYK